jgi:hypothetical protein
VLPRIESDVRPNTSYDLADEVLEWIDGNAPGEPLMPWQRYVVRRGFEVAEGKLWRQVVFLVSRQQGKTYMMQRVLLARASMAAAFGGASAVLNTHADVMQAVELLESIAREMGVGYLRAKSNGVDWWLDGEDVKGMGRGRVWRARAQTKGAITGQGGIGMVYIDELQDARREVINRTIRPVLSGSRVVNPQAWFTGTGERDESDVLRDLRKASEAEGSDVLWMEWSAPAGCGVLDEDAWRWASPDWSEQRAESLRADARAMPERDFRSEYLVSHEAQITVWMDPDLVRLRGVDRVRVGTALAGAVEVSMDGKWWSAAVAGDRDVAVCPPGGKEQAVAFIRKWQPRVLCVHASLVSQLPDGLAPLHRPSVAEQTAAVAVLDGLVREGSVRWDHGDEVAKQFTDVVLVNADGGPRISPAKSRGDVSLVKAIAVAVWRARQKREPVMV